MYILASNIWFTKLIKQFFFWIDKIVFNFISIIYDVMISIARTSVFTQADIADMADRIYKLLAIFMVFKVTLSLITYVVNPDDFSDKSKGVSKLGINIIISMALLILTPYIFNYAYQFQTIILEDNSLGVLIFGGDEANESFFNTAGDKIAYTTMTPFFTPNTSIDELVECSTLIGDGGEFNKDCSGLTEEFTGNGDDENSLYALTKDNENFTEQTLKNYVAGVEKGSLGLMFREEMVAATYENEDKETEFIMDYKFIFSTVTGVVIILLLITFCMDIAVRSLKLAFLQLVAPIPIISYVDPKSGKDGLFKKWYEMCIKTFLSLFIRLIALYFAVFVISKVADLKLVDVVDGSYVRNGIISVFIIIGALMFAKQLPKMLEGLGIKLDGDGKFFLNPFKKFEEGALGGKRLTGAVGGAVAGAIGGKGIGALTGAMRGFAANKGYKGGLDRQADVNRKIREARIGGAGFWGSRAAVLSSRYGLDDADLEREAINLRKDKRAIELKRREVDELVKKQEIIKKGKQDSIANVKKQVSVQSLVSEKIANMEDRAKKELALGHGGSIGQTYTRKKAIYEQLKNDGVAQVAITEQRIDPKTKQKTQVIIGYRDATEVEIRNGNVERYRKALPDEIVSAENDMNDELENATYEYISAVVNGGTNDGRFDNGKTDETLKTMYFEYTNAIDKAKEDGVKIKDRTTGTEEDFDTLTLGADLHKQLGKTKGSISYFKTKQIDPVEDEIKDIDDEIRKIQVESEVTISGEAKPITIESAEQEIKRREQELKDKQEQRKLNRGLAKDRRIGGGS